MSIVLLGSTSGSITLSEPAVAGTTVLDLPATSGNVVVDSATQTLTNKTIEGGTVISGTSVASTSGTSIDFTSIPSWVKRITVMFNGVSTSSTSILLVQLGDSGGVENTGYVSQAGSVFNTNNLTRGLSFTTGFGLYGQTSDATYVFTGVLSIFNITGTTFLASGSSLESTNTSASTLSGSKTLSGTLDRVRITTVNGTDTFDAGTINILYE